jgi:hypothetical protein
LPARLRVIKRRRLCSNQACALYQRSLDVLKSMQAGGTLMRANSRDLKDVAEAIARCGRELRSAR